MVRHGTRLQEKRSGGGVNNCANLIASDGSDLSIQAWGVPDPVSLNGNLTYNIRVTNNGPQMAEDVVITAILSPKVAQGTGENSP